MAMTVWTAARKRYVSSLTKNLILVVIGAAFGGEYLFKLTESERAVFLGSVSASVLVLLLLGLWFAVEGNDTEGNDEER